MVLKNLVQIQLTQERDGTITNQSMNFRNDNLDIYPVQSRMHTMDKCQNLIERDVINLRNILKMNSDRSNLSRSQQRALQELRKTDEIVIKMTVSQLQSF